jgi:hypothetical protein
MIEEIREKTHPVHKRQQLSKIKLLQRKLLMFGVRQKQYHIFNGHSNQSFFLFFLPLTYIRRARTHDNVAGDDVCKYASISLYSLSQLFDHHLFFVFFPFFLCSSFFFILLVGISYIHAHAFTF